MKVLGTLFRAWQLAQTAKKEKPVLALSHGSRAQIAGAKILGIPSLLIYDYEYAKSFIRPTWVMTPDVISIESIKRSKEKVLRYPGIKEDVYVPTFKPDGKLRDELGIKEEDILITIRPPATDAHYHNPESEMLFSEAVNLLGSTPDVRMVILPRNQSQETSIKSKWAEWCKNEKIIIPDHVVGGLNLLWHSDLVISGGGTMNREAAALGVPVYSIFRGKIGDVDRHLSNTGRLILLKSVEDIKTKLKIVKRVQALERKSGNNITLTSIVNEIVKVLETKA